MARKVALRPKARADIKDIARYTLDTWGEAQGRIYVREIDRMMKRLAEQPELGLKCPRIAPGLRAQATGKHLIFYVVADDTIDVVRVLHQRMDPARHLIL